MIVKSSDAATQILKYLGVEVSQFRMLKSAEFIIRCQHDELPTVEINMAGYVSDSLVDEVEEFSKRYVIKELTP